MLAVSCWVPAVLVDTWGLRESTGTKGHLEMSNRRRRRTRPAAAAGAARVGGLMRASRLVLALAALSASVAGAELPADGWPQSRRDAALTGRSSEPALPSARLRWLAFTGAELTGEPVVHDCAAYVTDGTGAVHAFNARSGAPLWSYERDYAVPPYGVLSALALDGPVLLAGLPVDPLLQRAFRTLPPLHTALQSYAIDNRRFHKIPPFISRRIFSIKSSAVRSSASLDWFLGIAGNYHT